MYSSPLTGLTIQYDRRKCEDDDNWVSTLDNSVNCSSLSPTDERCHHYNVNGDTGYESCPKACGNCFEDEPRESEDSDENMESQPMGLYSDENGETNEFDPLGSSSRGRGDLEDLVYKFTYEINDKINELSEKIDGVKDDTESQIAENESQNYGVCYKKVCRLKTEPPNTDTCNADGAADRCSRFMYSECQTGPNDCCEYIVPQNDDPSITQAPSPDPPTYKRAEPPEVPGVMGDDQCSNYGDEYIHLPYSPDVVDEDIKTYQTILRRGIENPETLQSNPVANQDFTVNIRNSSNTNIDIINSVKYENFTYISLSSSVTDSQGKINKFKITMNEFLNEKNISWIFFNKLSTDTSDIGQNIWSPYSPSHIQGETYVPSSSSTEYDYLVLKISTAENNPDICLNDDLKQDVTKCNIFKDKSSQYYIYSSFPSYTPQSDFTPYGNFYYGVLKKNEDSSNYTINYYPIQIKDDYEDSYPSSENIDPSNLDTTFRTSKNNFYDNYHGKIVGLYFQYNTERIIYQDDNGNLKVKDHNLVATIEYPLEDNDMETVTIEKILSINNLEAPRPFLYKIHDFDDDHNFNISKIKVKIANKPFFLKDYNSQCENSDWYWYVSIIALFSLGLWCAMFWSNIDNVGSYENPIGLITILGIFSGIIIILGGKSTRAITKLILYFLLIIANVYICIQKSDKESAGLRFFLIGMLFLILMIHIVSKTDFDNRFRDENEKDCKRNSLIILTLVVIVTMIFMALLISGSEIYDNIGNLSSIKLVILLIFIGLHISKYYDKPLEDKITLWFGYNSNDPDMIPYLSSPYFTWFRDIFLLLVFF